MTKKSSARSKKKRNLYSKGRNVSKRKTDKYRFIIFIGVFILAEIAIIIRFDSPAVWLSLPAIASSFLYMVSKPNAYK